MTCHASRRDLAICSNAIWSDEICRSVPIARASRVCVATAIDSHSCESIARWCGRELGEGREKKRFEGALVHEINGGVQEHQWR